MKVSSEWKKDFSNLLAEFDPKNDSDFPRKIYTKLLNIKWKIEKEERENEEKEEQQTVKRLLKAIIRELNQDE